MCKPISKFALVVGVAAVLGLSALSHSFAGCEVFDDPQVCGDGTTTPLSCDDAVQENGVWTCGWRDRSTGNIWMLPRPAYYDESGRLNPSQNNNLGTVCGERDICVLNEWEGQHFCTSGNNWTEYDYINEWEDDGACTVVYNGM